LGGTPRERRDPPNMDGRSSWLRLRSALTRRSMPEPEPDATRRNNAPEATGKPFEMEARVVRSKIQSSRLILGCLTIGFFAVGLTEALDEDWVRACRTVSMVAFMHLLFTLWNDCTDTRVMLLRNKYQTRLIVASDMVIVLALGSSKHIFLRSIAIFIVPAAFLREAESLEGTKWFIALHFLVTTALLRSEIFGAGAEWLASLVILDVMLIDLQSMIGMAKQIRHVLATTFEAISSFLALMCDGHIIENDGGDIVGADHKALDFFGIRPSQELGPGKLAASALICGSLSSVGLSNAELHTLDGRTFKAEVYTIKGEMSVEGVPLALKGGRWVPNCSGSMYFRGFRVLEEVFVDEEHVADASLPTQAQRAGAGDAVTGSVQPLKEWWEFPDEELLQSQQQPVQEYQERQECPERTQHHERQKHRVLLRMAPRLQDNFAAREPIEELASSVDIDDLCSQPASALADAESGGHSLPLLGIGVGEYKRLSIIARGSQGVVWKVEGPKGDHFAMKEVFLPGQLHRRDFTQNLRNADREVRSLKQLAWASRVIVQLFDCWVTQDFKAYMVMEWLPTTLASALQAQRTGSLSPWSMLTRCRYCAHLAVGLSAIHSEGIMHRDIKPANVLLAEDLRTCKIADLGLSRPLHRTSKSQPRAAVSEASYVSEPCSIISGYTEKRGTLAFTSPEVLRGSDYDCSADIFSLGCVFLELLTLLEVKRLRMPGDSDVPKITPALLQAEPPEGSPEEVDLFTSLRQLCVRMLDSRASARPAAGELACSEPLRPHVEALAAECRSAREVVRSRRLQEEQP